MKKINIFSETNDSMEVNAQGSLSISEEAQEKFEKLMKDNEFYGKCSFQEPRKFAELIAEGNKSDKPISKESKLYNWPLIKEELSFQENLSAVNPNYKKHVKWQINCQRCVPTYEMRKRGYDVTAKPREGNDIISLFPGCVWVNPEYIDARGSGKNRIERSMAEWGDGARAQITVRWKYGGGHTFIAEQRDGKTYYIDPQTADTDVEWYFDNVEKDTTRFWRIDNLDTTSYYIEKCCKKRGFL